MSIQLVVNALIIVALLIWVGYRQLSWRVADIARMVRMPIILAIVGVVTLARGTKAPQVTTFDVSVIIVELVIGIVIGGIIGALATFVPMTQEQIDAHQRDGERRRGSRLSPATTGSRPAATMMTRTGWFGLALWLVVIVARVGIDVWATAAGSTLAMSTGVILLMFAANRLARVAVMAYRLNRVPAPVA